MGGWDDWHRRDVLRLTGGGLAAAALLEQPQRVPVGFHATGLPG